MNASYALLDLRRLVRNPGVIIFAGIMPVGFYVLFAAIQSYSDDPVGHGNVGAVIMASMACYGVVLAAVDLGAGAALEFDSGWGRQLALTPMAGATQVCTKVVTVLLVCLLPVSLVLVAGALTGAEVDGLRWLAVFLLCWVSVVPFAALGLTLARFLRAEVASAVGSFTVVALAFLGNMFFPLSGTMLTIARFTPPLRDRRPGAFTCHGDRRRRTRRSRPTGGDVGPGAQHGGLDPRPRRGRPPGNSTPQGTVSPGCWHRETAG